MGKTVAVLGLGIIGSRAANCLNTAGYQVRTWNRTPKERDDFVSTPQKAAEGADFVALYLKDGNAVRNVFEQIKDTLHAQPVILNHSTIDLKTTQWLESECQNIGCQFLDAPFTGSKVAAGDGALVYYVGGNSDVLEASQTVLEATSKEIKHLGPVGSATVVKLATNLISASTVQALSEALAIAQNHGIDPSLFTESVASNACGSMLAQMKLPSMAAGDYDTHFSLENMLKDSRFALELAKEAGISTPGIQVTSDAMADRCAQGDAQLDFSALFKAYK